jgi:hypothetical protein
LNVAVSSRSDRETMAQSHSNHVAENDCPSISSCAIQKKFDPQFQAIKYRKRTRMNGF